MPLYKRSLNVGKDKADENKPIVSDTLSLSAMLSLTDTSMGEMDHHHHYHNEEVEYNQNMSTAGYDPTSLHSTYPAVTAEVSSEAHSAFVPVSAAMVPRPEHNDLKPPGEKEAPGGTNLPDDLQHALDIIYRGPINFPPPNMAMMGVPPPQPAYNSKFLITCHKKDYFLIYLCD